MITFEGYDKRINKINETLKKYGFKNLEECENLCINYGVNVNDTVKNTQPICFDNAVYAYVLGSAIAIKNKAKTYEECANFIGEGLEAFCVSGSVADNRKVGIGHGKLAAKLLNEDTKCFCFLAGHESFAAAEGAIKISEYANKVRKNKLKVILLGLGKDAAYIIARINGFTFIDTFYDINNNKLEIISEKRFSNTSRGDIKIYGAYEVNEGVAIMEKEEVDVSITGNSTNPVRFQHLVAGIYKNRQNDKNKEYFSVASGGGTGRTLHPDNLGAGPSSYGLTDTLGRVHADAQFAGSSSVPSHVDMMGFIGMGNNPMVGATVSLAVQVIEKLQQKQ